jgi:hypothetical protein
MMAATRPAGFRFRKWYLDCVAEDGGAVIGYCARLWWGPVRMEYAALLDAPADGEPRQWQVLRGGGWPEQAGSRCVWRAPGLELEGSWTATAPPVERVLLATPRGGIRWRCHQPASSVRLGWRMGATERSIAGTGYAEELELTLPPGRLPFRRLWWGRFVAPGASLVWIQWRGRTNRRIALLDGAPHRRPMIAPGDGGVRVEGAGELCYGETRPLRERPLAESVFGGVPGLLRLLPPRFRAARESKRLSHAELRRPGLAPAVGWAIHEVVEW